MFSLLGMWRSMKLNEAGALENDEGRLDCSLGNPLALGSLDRWSWLGAEPVALSLDCRVLGSQLILARNGRFWEAVVSPHIEYLHSVRLPIHCRDLPS